MTHNYWTIFSIFDHSGGRQCSCRAIVARKTTGEERGHLHSWPFSQALALLLCYWVLLGTGLGWADWVHCKSTADYSTGWLSSLSLHARVNKAILGKSLMPEHELLGVAQKQFWFQCFQIRIPKYQNSKIKHGFLRRPQSST